jgi:hypothetical protein
VVVPPAPVALPDQEASEASLGRLRKLLAALDVDGDGAASRRDMLLAFRRDRQLADHLKMPPRIKVGCRLPPRQGVASWCSALSYQPTQVARLLSACWMVAPSHGRRGGFPYGHIQPLPPYRVDRVTNTPRVT